MPRYLLPLIFGIVGTAILVSLGNWQVRRLAEKEAYLSAIDARIADAPVEVPAIPDPVEDRFLPVTATGVLTSDELHVLVSVKKVGPGYRIVSAFEMEDGRRIMVDRGFVRTSQKEAARYTGPASVIGNLHWPEEIDSFTPENDITGNIWFARDVPAMAAALDTEPVLVILRETSENDTTVTPLPVDSSGIPNDHLQYIVTWYGLAIVWAAMTLYYLRRMRKTKKA
ncbi:SURF1 family protein [Shimia thalassica]|uniref:SURF1 family protein n=1 Tax=Shimia thalassica TaxID=1715693 RepID=UPI000C08DA97|nr:SURF1 family protein [Shimia thalassica]MBU2944535.1 SURF1 family protein [Shimia thalassica]MDO6502119.1 SURF1 family protein [Shimia thalassica]PHO03264.1 cytochrome oxidase biogenesis protein Surf1, facilitates heme A insertion [Rhodobacteraceae bacterium 4F10]